MRRNALEIAVTVAVVAFVLAGLYLGLWGKFHRSYLGRTEAQVVAALGSPMHDSRSGPDYHAGDPYWLGWYFAVGRTLTLHFEDGTVVRQEYGDK